MVQKTLKLLLLLGVLVAVNFSLVSATTTPVYASADGLCQKCPGGETPNFDTACQRRKILDPKETCDVCLCPGEQPSQGQELINLNLLGVTLRLKGGYAVVQLLFVGFNLFFGVVAIVATAFGIYAAYQRSNAEKEEDVKKSTKTMINVFAGIAVILTSLVLAQILATFLGVGSLAEIADFSGLIGGQVPTDTDTIND